MHTLEHIINLMLRQTRGIHGIHLLQSHSSAKISSSLFSNAIASKILPIYSSLNIIYDITPHDEGLLKKCTVILTTYREKYGFFECCQVFENGSKMILPDRHLTCQKSPFFPHYLCRNRTTINTNKRTNEQVS